MTRTSTLAALLFTAMISSVFGQTSWTISSPGDKVKSIVQLADLGGTADYPAGIRLYFSVSTGGPTAYSEVVEPSPLGLVRSDAHDRFLVYDDNGQTQDLPQLLQ
jgi:hypothetical protein